MLGSAGGEGSRRRDAMERRRREAFERRRHQVSLHGFWESDGRLGSRAMAWLCFRWVICHLCFVSHPDRHTELWSYAG